MNPIVISDTKKANQPAPKNFQNKELTEEISEGMHWITPYHSYLKLDGCTQSRICENRGVIKKYGQIMFEGNWKWFEGEPIVLFWDKENKLLWVGDGHHRLKAAQEQYLHQIYVEIRLGTFLDAKIFNCTSNGTHALVRS